MSAPTLRFKEFTENWNLNNLLSLSENGFTNGVFNDPAKVGSGYKLVNVLDMYIETTIDETKLKLVELDEAEFIKNKVEYGDVFFTRSSLVKEGIAYSNTYLGKSEDITFDGHLIRMRPIKNLLNSSFLNYLLKTSMPRNQLVKRGKTATMTTIGQADIAEVVIKYPSKLEQSKIANFLTAVDEKISQLTQKHDLLTQYKKGVMQQIFRQELRFKDDDGADFADWEKVSLENVLDYEQPTKYLVSSTEYSNSFKTPVLTAGKTFILGYTDETTGICDEGLPLIIFDDFTTAFKFVQFPFKAKSSAMKLLRKKAMVNIYYVYSAMQLIDFPSGDEHKRYWISEYSKVLIPLPCENEQTKIANFLTAIDDKITATQSQLHAVKQFKQGLLQQMFV